MRSIFFGTPRFAQIVLEKLIDSKFQPQLVVTAPDAKVGRGQKLQPSPVKKMAEKYRIPILQSTNLNESDVKGQLSNVDLAILVAYGKIIPKDLLSIPKFGFINVHPSLLPKYRGPSPIQSAILAGEGKTGISIMLLDEKVDHGPILAQKEIEIEKDDTHASLIEKLGKLGADLLIQTLSDYLNGSVKPKSQNHQKATFTKRITKEHGKINLENPPNPQTFDRMIRAFYPWPGVWTRLQTTNNKLQTIKFLPGKLIQPEGKRPMTVKEILNGYPKFGELIKKIMIVQ